MENSPHPPEMPVGKPRSERRHTWLLWLTRIAIIVFGSAFFLWLVWRKLIIGDDLFAFSAVIAVLVGIPALIGISKKQKFGYVFGLIFSIPIVLWLSVRVLRELYFMALYQDILAYTGSLFIHGVLLAISLFYLYLLVQSLRQWNVMRMTSDADQARQAQRAVFVHPRFEKWRARLLWFTGAALPLSAILIIVTLIKIKSDMGLAGAALIGLQILFLATGIPALIGIKKRQVFGYIYNIIFLIPFILGFVMSAASDLFNVKVFATTMTGILNSISSIAISLLVAVLVFIAVSLSIKSLRVLRAVKSLP